jgi:hypothetical protein
MGRRQVLKGRWSRPSRALGGVAGRLVSARPSASPALATAGPSHRRPLATGPP